jgi:hypothetical protein
MHGQSDVPPARARFDVWGMSTAPTSHPSPDDQAILARIGRAGVVGQESTEPGDDSPQPVELVEHLEPANRAVPLSAEQIQQITDARAGAKKITFAAGVATFSGWALICFATLTLLFGIFDVVALLLGAGLMMVGLVELRSAKRLRTFELVAPKHLAVNQLALCVMLCLYAGYGIYAALTGPGVYDQQIAANPGFRDTLEPIARLHTVVAVAFYACLAGGSMLMQGLTALYYWTRRKHIVRYIERTPDWLVQAVRATAA